MEWCCLLIRSQSASVHSLTSGPVIKLGLILLKRLNVSEQMPNRPDAKAFLNLLRISNGRIKWNEMVNVRLIKERKKKTPHWILFYQRRYCSSRSWLESANPRKWPHTSGMLFTVLAEKLPHFFSSSNLSIRFHPLSPPPHPLHFVKCSSKGHKRSLRVVKWAVTCWPFAAEVYSTPLQGLQRTTANTRRIITNLGSS